ncbi:MlrC C-terminal domain-containing protein [Pseudomonas viridiflava]|jgi:microcystin degradation protein MlrC
MAANAFSQSAGLFGSFVFSVQWGRKWKVWFPIDSVMSRFNDAIRSCPYAVVHKGDVYIVVTQLPQTYIDPNFYRAMQVSVEDKDVLVARSGYHFSLNFASLGECVTADTPGMTAYHPKDQAFTVARPFYPVDDISYSPVRTFQPARA